MLLKNTGFSIFEIFKNQKFWGGTATDFEGRKVDLGMLAGALVNKNDISKDLFTPDVQRPKIKILHLIYHQKEFFVLNGHNHCQQKQN